MDVFKINDDDDDEGFHSYVKLFKFVMFTVCKTAVDTKITGPRGA